MTLPGGLKVGESIPDSFAQSGPS
ncbi:MAG: hypothetical protein QOD33_1096, partial [Pyrinomonadaceae bacterium]|nr:hypothetical protein [Pyrinomonadaceae bacterium]